MFRLASTLALTSFVFGAMAPPANGNPNPKAVDRDYLLVAEADLAGTGSNLQAFATLSQALQAGDFDQARTFYADNYVQHNPDMGDGFEGVMARARQAGGADLTFLPILTFAEGPYVATCFMLRAGKDAPALAIVDLSLFRGGKSAEHWEIVMAPQAAGHSLFAPIQPPATDVPRAEVNANKQRAADFINEAFNRKRLDAAGEFVAKDVVRHGAPGNGLASWREDMLLPENAEMEYDIKRIIGQGDIVLAHSRVTLGNRDHARADLFRLAGGRIIEHWQVTQAVPEQMRHVNGMF